MQQSTLSQCITKERVVCWVEASFGSPPLDCWKFVFRKDIHIRVSIKGAAFSEFSSDRLRFRAKERKEISSERHRKGTEWKMARVLHTRKRAHHHLIILPLLQVTYLEIYREHVRDLLASTRAPPSYFQDNDSETDDGSEPGSDSEANSAGGGRPRAPSLRVMVQAKLAAQRLVKRARKLNPKPSAATRFWKAPGEEGDVTIEDDVGSDVASVASSEASVEAPVRSGLSQTKGVSSTLKIREHPDKGPYVEGLTERHVSSWAEMAQLLEEGSKNRTIAATDMNKVSSRSHTVFTLTLTQVGDWFMSDCAAFLLSDAVFFSQFGSGRTKVLNTAYCRQRRRVETSS
jgi:hypothetical protein